MDASDTASINPSFANGNNAPILITGCSSGIGLCAAQSLHAQGYRVFATVRNSEDKMRLEQLGLTCLLLDLNSSTSIQTVVTEFLSQTNGHLYALINNAGFGQMGAVEDLSRDNLRAQFETNVFGLQELTNRLLPTLRQQPQARIINVSSVLGLVTMNYRGAYCASKYALEALSDAMRLELRTTKIKVILIEPGPITSQFRATAAAVYNTQVNAESSPHKLIYAELFSRLEYKKNTSRFTLSPQAVVEKMLHALQSPKPKIRYYVTAPTYLLAFLKRLLPSRWLDLLLVNR